MFIVGMWKMGANPEGVKCVFMSGIQPISLAHFATAELDHAQRVSLNISSHIIPGDFTATVPQRHHRSS